MSSELGTFIYVPTVGRNSKKKTNGTSKRFFKDDSSKQIYEAWRDKLVFFNSM